MIRQPTAVVEMEVDDLADFMFRKNKTDARLELELNGIEDAKDLFCFCVDLMCKGLVMTCAEPGQTTVDLDEVSMEQFVLLSRKMALGGIIVKLKVDSNDLNTPSMIDMGSKYKDPNKYDLSDYEFTITTPKHIYTVGFELKNHI